MAIPFEPDEIVRSLGDALINDINLIASEFVRIVVPASPVKTGHFRRNWQVNIGVPTGNELPGVDASGQATVVNAETRLRASVNRNPFLPVFIENNVPYAARLNSGSSTQAPAMFVEMALAAALRVGDNRRTDLPEARR